MPSWIADKVACFGKKVYRIVGLKGKVETHLEMQGQTIYTPEDKATTFKNNLQTVFTSTDSIWFLRDFAIETDLLTRNISRTHISIFN